MNLLKAVSGIKLKSIGKSILHRDRIGRTDLGILKVAFMVAALDGVATDDEYEAFAQMAKKCRGYSEVAAKKALEDAMRSAGYLLLLSRRVGDSELMRAFVIEAEASLPDGFAYLSIEDVRRAIIMWVAMGMSDGDYSARERKCIEALRRHFAEVKVRRVKEDEERWATLLSPSFCQTYGDHRVASKIEIVSKDFIVRVEKAIAEHGTVKDAQSELNALIAHG